MPRGFRSEAIRLSVRSPPLLSSVEGHADAPYALVCELEFLFRKNHFVTSLPRKVRIAFKYRAISRD